MRKARRHSIVTVLEQDDGIAKIAYSREFGGLLASSDCDTVRDYGSVPKVAELAERAMLGHKRLFCLARNEYSGAYLFWVSSDRAELARRLKALPELCHPYNTLPPELLGWASRPRTGGGRHEEIS